MEEESVVQQQPELAARDETRAVAVRRDEGAARRALVVELRQELEQPRRELAHRELAVAVRIHPLEQRVALRLARHLPRPLRRRLLLARRHVL